MQHWIILLLRTNACMHACMHVCNEQWAWWVTGNRTELFKYSSTIIWIQLAGLAYSLRLYVGVTWAIVERRIIIALVVGFSQQGHLVKHILIRVIWVPQHATHSDKANDGLIFLSPNTYQLSFMWPWTVIEECVETTDSLVQLKYLGSIIMLLLYQFHTRSSMLYTDHNLSR